MSRRLIFHNQAHPSDSPVLPDDISGGWAQSAISYFLTPYLVYLQLLTLLRLNKKTLRSLRRKGVCMVLASKRIHFINFLREVSFRPQGWLIPFMNLIPFSFVDKGVKQLCGLKLISAIGACIIRKCDQEKGRHLDEFRGSEALVSPCAFFLHPQDSRVYRCGSDSSR